MHEAITEDLLLDGRVRLRQPARGYRANLDSVLLAAAVEPAPGATLLEAGCGVGAALLCAAALAPETHFIGVEREEGVAALARENVRLNALDARVTIETADALTGGAPVDGVFANPPYDSADEARMPDASRAYAHTSSAPIDLWIRRLADRLHGGATLTLIHRAHRLGDILAALEGRLGGVQVLPVRPRALAPAKRVLVRARKGSRAPLALLAGIDLHDGSGEKYAPAVEAVVRGEARISWD